jgi:hypothetical protein
MATMQALAILVGMGAVLLACVAAITLQQAEHRRTGLLPGPDPRTATGAILHSVLGAVPVRRVRQGSVEFEDGSGLLLAAPDRMSLVRLSGLAAAGEIVLERVYELTVGWRLVFSGESGRALVDVGAFQVAESR